MFQQKLCHKPRLWTQTIVSSSDVNENVYIVFVLAAYIAFYNTGSRNTGFKNIKLF